MKKIVVSIFTFVLLLGVGTGVLAATDKIECNWDNFKEMIPFMQEKHPNFSEKDLKDMHKSCASQMQKAAKSSDLNN